MNLKQSSLLGFLLINLFTSQVFASDELKAELLQRISNAHQDLSTIQHNINTDSIVLSEKIARHLQEINKLRSYAAAIQRVADEELLSFEQLKSRVELWSTQNNYQNQLFSSFVENSALELSQFRQSDGETLMDVNVLATAMANLESRLSPRWQSKQVVSNTGAFETTNVLEIGPISVAYSNLKHNGGPLADISNTESKILDDIYQEDAINELGSIYNHGKGKLTFDPSLGNAYKIMNQGDSVFDHLAKGGVWTLPIIFFGLFSMLVSIFKAVQLIRLPRINKKLVDEVKQLVQVKNSEHSSVIELSSLSAQAKGAQRNLLEIAKTTAISQERDDLLIAYLIEYKHKIERFLGIITTSAAIAPLLGLLGTVSGMITTFMMMKTFGTSDASTVSGGISEALITTELGLIVAIPSLIMSALLSRKTKSYHAKLETDAIKLSKVNFA